MDGINDLESREITPMDYANDPTTVTEATARRMNVLF